MRLTTLVVAPLMLLEAATALWLVFDRPGFLSRAQAWTGLGLLASTYAALVATNWIRAAAWTGRSVLLLAAASRRPLVSEPQLDMGEGALEGTVRSQLEGWFGPQVRRWRHLRTYRVRHAQPEQRPGALLSGRRAPEAVMLERGRA